MTGGHWDDRDNQNDRDDLVAGFVSRFKQKIQGLLKDTFPILQGFQCLEYILFLVLPQHDGNFNFYPEGLSVFAPFKHLRIWVG